MNTSNSEFAKGITSNTLTNFFYKLQFYKLTVNHFAQSCIRANLKRPINISTDDKTKKKNKHTCQGVCKLTHDIKTNLTKTIQSYAYLVCAS